MPSPDGDLVTDLPPGHAIVVGYGVPGRSCAEWLKGHRWTFTVVERNDDTVDRCGKTGVPIVAGDATDDAVLRRAGIDRAALVAVTIPDEQAVLTIIARARALNPAVRIVVRVYHVSVAFEAVKRGADQTVVAEELAGREFVRLLDGGRSAFRARDAKG